jgi:hypothetical protein
LKCLRWGQSLVESFDRTTSKKPPRFTGLGGFLLVVLSSFYVFRRLPDRLTGRKDYGVLSLVDRRRVSWEPGGDGSAG